MTMEDTNQTRIDAFLDVYEAIEARVADSRAAALLLQLCVDQQCQEEEDPAYENYEPVTANQWAMLYNLGITGFDARLKKRLTYKMARQLIDVLRGCFDERQTVANR